MTREGCSLRRAATRFLLALVAVSIVALFAGWLYGRTSPERAGARLVADLVIEEPEGAAPIDPVAPTSGMASGEPTCGVEREPVPTGRQLATLAAGGVVIQYRPLGVGDDEREALAVLVGPDVPVLLAPNPDLRSRVVATAWTRRLPLETVSPGLLRAFVDAYGEDGACA